MAAAPTTPGQPQDRGIFDCDDAHRSPLRTDYERIFNSGLVVLDTNVLLNLYRSNESTRRDTLAALSKLRERLWIPHQVLSEFWRTRELASVRTHHGSKADEATTALDKAVESAEKAVKAWVTAVQLKDNNEATQRTEKDLKGLTSAVSSLKEFIRNQAECDALKNTDATHTDPVLIALEPLLRGRIGEPPPRAEYDEAVQEAEKRAEKKTPPGYKDFGTKPTELAAGDYLLWVQLLAEARARSCDVLLVTGDVKKDWWTNRGYGIPPRPRAELVTELRQKAGVRLFMLTPGELLTWAKELLDVDVAEDSVRGLEQLGETAAEEAPEDGDWTAESLATFMDELWLRRRSRVKVIVAAAANGGFVDRKTVYHLGGYSSAQKLSGFTKPIRTLARYLESTGELTGSEPLLLKTVYGSPAKPSASATDFRVPSEVIPLLREMCQGTELWLTGGRRGSWNEQSPEEPDDE